MIPKIFKMKKRFFILSMLSAVIACGGPSGRLDAPENDPDFTPSSSILADPAELIVQSGGGTVQTSITSSGSWVLNGGESWCTPSKTSGSGNDDLFLTVAAATSLNDRSAHYTLTCGTAEAKITITQKGIEGMSGDNEGISSGNDITY